MRPCLLALAIALATSATACVATSSPRIRACAVSGASASSEGVLRILPSGVPGVEIDSAYWLTAAGMQDIGTWEQLNYYSRLRTTRRVRRDEIAVVYESETQRPVFDLEVRSSVEGSEVSRSSAAARAVLERGDTTTAVRVIHRDGDLTMGRWSSIGYCPRTVRLVPRADVPFLLMPRLTSDSVRAVAASSAAAQRSPLVVLRDTVLAAARDGGTALVGAAINTADTALTDMIIGLVTVRISDAPRGAATTAEAATEDTLEYHVGPVAPRARVGFVLETQLRLDAIVERTTYPASRITDRPLPLGASRRVSDARRLVAEEASTHREVQRRAFEPFSTDSDSYTVLRGREIRPGVFQHSLVVVAHWTNGLATPLFLGSCSATTRVPAYSVVVTAGAQSSRRSAYSADSMCAKQPPIEVAPGVTRVDTLHLSASARHDPSGLAGLQEPRLYGIFELRVDVSYCPDGSTCRVEMPMLTRSSRFRIYPYRSER